MEARFDLLTAETTAFTERLERQGAFLESWRCGGLPEPLPSGANAHAAPVGAGADEGHPGSGRSGDRRADQLRVVGVLGAQHSRPASSAFGGQPPNDASALDCRGGPPLGSSRGSRTKLGLRPPSPDRQAPCTSRSGPPLGPSPAAPADLDIDAGGSCRL